MSKHSQESSTPPQRACEADCKREACHIKGSCAYPTGDIAQKAEAWDAVVTAIGAVDPDWMRRTKGSGMTAAVAAIERMGAASKLALDTGKGCSVCGHTPVVNVSGTYWLCGECVNERLTPSSERMAVDVTEHIERPRGNWDPNETTEERNARLDKIKEFVDSCNEDSKQRFVQSAGTSITLEKWLSYQPWVELVVNGERLYTASTVEAAWRHGVPVVSSATGARICPYCTSDNPAIRTTYYDQTCEGCVKRMGKP